jgi:hypothetical protein
MRRQTRPCAPCAVCRATRADRKRCQRPALPDRAQRSRPGASRLPGGRGAARPAEPGCGARRARRSGLAAGAAAPQPGPGRGRGHASAQQLHQPGVAERRPAAQQPAVEHSGRRRRRTLQRQQLRERRCRARWPCSASGAAAACLSCRWLRGPRRRRRTSSRICVLPLNHRWRLADAAGGAGAGGRAAHASGAHGAAAARHQLAPRARLRGGRRRVGGGGGGGDRGAGERRSRGATRPGVAVSTGVAG